MGNIARCEHVWIVEKNKQDNTSKMYETLIRTYEEDGFCSTIKPILSKVDEYLDNNATITITNRKNQSETIINTITDFVLWGRDLFSSDLTYEVIRGSYQIPTSNGVKHITFEFTWVDFYEYSENPMFELELYDFSSGNLIEKKIYKTDKGIENYLERNIEYPKIDGDTIAVYKNKRCNIHINGINVTECCINPSISKMVLCSAPNWTSSVYAECDTSGVF